MGCGCSKSKSSPGINKRSITLSPTSKIVSLGSSPIIVSVSSTVSSLNLPSNNVAGTSQERNISKDQRDMARKRREAVLRRQGRI